jgi:DNA-binding NarL/FixJ family response regulator
MCALRVLIADPLEEFRQRLLSLLETRPDTVVCGQVSDGRELIESTRILRPNLIVAEISLPIINGLEAAELIRQSDTQVIILLTSFDLTNELLVQAKHIGANGFVEKMRLGETMMLAIETLVRGEPFFPAGT